MSRSMGARRRMSVKSSTVRTISHKDTHPDKAKAAAGKKVNRTEKEPKGNLFWTSAEIVLAEVGPLGIPTGPNKVRKPGATVRRVTNFEGRVGYCHASMYDKIVAQEREKALAVLEGKKDATE